MYRTRNIKVFFIIAIVFIVFAIVALAMSDPEITSMESVGSVDGRLEFLSGQNIYQDNSGSLVLDIESFERVGDAQYFSLTFKNNNCYTAHSTITINVPTEYFSVQSDDSFEIQPGQIGTYRFSIQLVDAPSSGTSFSMNFRIHTEYLP